MLRTRRPTPSSQGRDRSGGYLSEHHQISSSSPGIPTIVDLTYGRLFEISYGGSVCDEKVLLRACDSSVYPTESMLGIAGIGKNFMMFLQVRELIIVPM